MSTSQVPQRDKTGGERPAQHYEWARTHWYKFQHNKSTSKMERGLQSRMKRWMKLIIFSLMFFFLFVCLFFYCYNLFFFLNHIKLMDIHIKTLNLINIDIFTHWHTTPNNSQYTILTLANIYGPNNDDLFLFHSFFSFINDWRIVTIDGDLNTLFTPKIYPSYSSSNSRFRHSTYIINHYMNSYRLDDSWRINNPTSTQ